MNKMPTIADSLLSHYRGNIALLRQMANMLVGIDENTIIEQYMFGDNSKLWLNGDGQDFMTTFKH